MAKQSGKHTYVEFGGQDLSVSLRDFNVEYTQNTADSTAGGDEYENSIDTTKAVKMTATAVALKKADGGAAIKAVLFPGNVQDLYWGWEGSNPGGEKGGASARVTKFSIKANYKNVIMWDVEWENAGETLLANEATDTW